MAIGTLSFVQVMDNKSYTEYPLEIGCSEKLIVGVAL
jgi:hypothetical protein